MFHFLVFLISLYQLSPITLSETIETSKLSINDLNNDDFNPKSGIELPSGTQDYPTIKANDDESEIDFDDPLSSVNIDYLNNALILQFKKQRQKQQAAMNNFMRFGKRQMESMPTHQALESYEPGTRFERSNGPEGVRDSRADNFMRFGRPNQNFMRLGRSPSSDFMRFGRSPSSDFMRFGRSPSSDFMRFGRSPSSDFMRFGRSPSSDFMRFGRTPSDFMRFGRTPSDFMRFGRNPSDFMRFGRSASDDFMRFGRSPSDFMRFGRTPSDFMRFGRSPSPNFMRLGRSSDMSNTARNNKPSRSDMEKNFMRFGRPDSFLRFGRAPSNSVDTSPNFMRFGKRQQNKIQQNFSDHNRTEKTTLSDETTTTFPYQQLENDVDMIFLNDLNASNDDN